MAVEPRGSCESMAHTWCFDTFFPHAKHQIVTGMAGFTALTKSRSRATLIRPKYGGRSSMAEHLTVDEVVAGSSPVDHPTHTGTQRIPTHNCGMDSEMGASIVLHLGWFAVV